MNISTTIREKVILSSKGQVVIPKSLRIKLGMHSGNELLLLVRLDGVLEIKPIKRSIAMLFGCCKRPNQKPMTVKEMDKAIMKAVSE
ncbi:MAG: hypothetical protein A3E82_01610 [Gammaproteobacteria bacterium RIFCSPHIGHO2_12_FULL_38_11]|nr:MAG: hypothetical protein A3E82_01610 [Gammaproteobacteria bacterium RIFCSPHIGHO2_12_FULL_38_11]